MPYLLKTLLAACIIVAVTEVSKSSTFAGALIKSLPTVSVISLIWVYAETRDAALIASLSSSTFWLVLPTLPMFLVLPALLARGIKFGWSMAACILLTFGLYMAAMWIYRWFGIRL